MHLPQEEGAHTRSPFMDMSPQPGPKFKFLFRIWFSAVVELVESRAARAADFLASSHVACRVALPLVVSCVYPPCSLV